MGLFNPGKIGTSEIHDWNRETKTNTTHTSRNIYDCCGSIRYFSLQELVEVKNPRYLILIMQNKGWRRWCVDIPLDYLKSALVGLASRWMEKLLGPGFESQVPQNLYSIFLHMFTCRFQKVVHHAPQISVRHVASGQDLVAKDEGPSYSAQISNASWLAKQIQWSWMKDHHTS